MFYLTHVMVMCIFVVMYITRPRRTSRNGKTYHTILLRESYREGRRVKNRTIANLTHCKPEEIEAIELALKHKGDLTALASLKESVDLKEGLSVGAVCTVYEIAKRLGIEKGKVAEKEIVHDRCKDLALVEFAFRTCKTAHLEVRPVYVRTEESTRGHVVVVMLAYRIIRELQRAWASFDLTVEEGLQQLSTLCSTEIWIKNKASSQKVPEPRDASKALLEALDVRLPTILPHRKVNVVTRRKLPERRKTA